ncbi:MAG: cytochrome c oxidase subunit 3 [Pseudomonadales bacterium]|nr:cytochrome c oxidase subunit 3 [Pseudomonadales bacterium]
MSGQHNSDYQTYYVPEQSWMAILASIALGLMVIGAAGGINSLTYKTDGSTSWVLLIGGMMLLAGVLATWFTITIRENLAGMNSAQLKRSYRLGMQWFIFSEVMFFFCFFGVLLYLRTLSGPWLSGDGAGVMNTILWPNFVYEWPLMATPQDAMGGLDAQNAAGHLANNGVHKGPAQNMAFPGFADLLHWLPFWNTLLLVSSSVFLEFAHHALKHDKRRVFNLWLAATLVFGFSFVILQIVEYHEAYSEYGLFLNSGVYGATFFLLTGFHGFHVCMGACILLVQFCRSVMGRQFTAEDHFGFEAASWYWHFVDVVWICLVFVVYLF